MKERPILFSAPMVRAILAGTKTQTRRAVKPQPALVDPRNSRLPGLYRNGDFAWRDKGAPLGCATISCKPNGPDGWALENSPFGQPGDRLWVRETWLDLQGTGIERATGDLSRYAYAADTPPGSHGDECRKNYGLRWRPSIHMPRWASRITLEITGVRVERLQGISEADAEAEGCAKNHNGYYLGGPHAVSGRKQMATAQSAYRDLWESINGAGSWEANPWVWVVEFKRVEGSAT